MLWITVDKMAAFKHSYPRLKQSLTLIKFMLIKF